MLGAAFFCGIGKRYIFFMEPDFIEPPFIALIAAVFFLIMRVLRAILRELLRCIMR